MPSLITQVKSKLFIHSAQKSMHALDGAYASLFHGRSLDFEDLRKYEYGDQVRDIDWRATARQGTPLVKRSRATRMHTVLFVVDSGLSMAALAKDERPKRDLAILATGALGYLALRHGDDFSLIHGDAARVQRRAPGRSEAALEHTLRTVDAALRNASAPSAREALLSYVSRTISRRMIVVIVTDEAPVTEETERLLRRLRVQHDVLWLTLSDADPVVSTASTRRRRDVLSSWAVPDFVQGDRDVIRELNAVKEAERTRRDEMLDSLAISHTELHSQDTAVSALLTLLNRRSNARAR